MTSLDTGIKNVKNVQKYIFGDGCVLSLKERVHNRRTSSDSWALFVIDDFFEKKQKFVTCLGAQPQDQLLFISAAEEPKTSVIDALKQNIENEMCENPCAVVGIGGGVVMDTAKALANLFTNPGPAAAYQGWDLLSKPAIYKIGVPTISGTGAEATRTCVMTNEDTRLKLGMNSDYTVFDELLLDPDLTKTVPRAQYFYTGMDAYIHCVESLNGVYRHPVGDAFSHQTIQLCRAVFYSDNMMSDENREKLMVASYLGGCSIATSYVGLVHPFSAGLSVVLGLHHCVANCIVLNAMSEFYPAEVDEFKSMCEAQKIELPTNVCGNLADDQFDQLHDATLIHEKPLTNALGIDFRKVLTKQVTRRLFTAM